jgi:CRISPR system Cascade subunit CasC
MTQPRFIEIHWLTAYPAALLNRDQDGLGKRMPFGGTVRGRVSSQCIKRHLRFAGGNDAESAKGNEWSLQSLGAAMSERTRELVERRILPQALNIAAVQPNDAVLRAVEEQLLKDIYGEKAKPGTTEARQALVFGSPEIAHIAKLAAEALKLPDAKAATEALKGFFKAQRTNMNAMKNNAGLEAALFGRMVTSDPAANTEAAVHVAHALTVHPIEREMDFMSVVDDLKQSDESADAGAAGTFDAELTSGLYYNYMVVDVAGLTANLGGDQALAGQVVERLIHLAAEVSPGAKKGSTAPYAYAELVLVETGSRQPRTLGNAFREPVRARTNTMFADTLKKLSEYVANVDVAYGNHRERRLMTVDPTANVSGATRMSLDELAGWAGQQAARQAPGAAVA